MIIIAAAVVQTLQPVVPSLLISELLVFLSVFARIAVCPSTSPYSKS